MSLLMMIAVVNTIIAVVSTSLLTSFLKQIDQLNVPHVVIQTADVENAGSPMATYSMAGGSQFTSMIKNREPKDFKWSNVNFDGDAYAFPYLLSMTINLDPSSFMRTFPVDLNSKLW